MRDVLAAALFLTLLWATVNPDEVGRWVNAYEDARETGLTREDLKDAE